MGLHLDRAGCAVQSIGHVLDAEVAVEAQHQDGTIVAGQPIQRLQQRQLAGDIRLPGRPSGS